MNGSPTHPAGKHERETTAADLCVLRRHEGIASFARANGGRARGFAP